VCNGEVNRAFLRRRLGRLALTLTDEAPADACLIDHDHLPFGMAPEEVVLLLKTFTGRPRCVHGYNIPPRLARWRRRHGVRLHRRRLTELASGGPANRMPMRRD